MTFCFIDILNYLRIISLAPALSQCFFHYHLYDSLGCYVLSFI